MKDLKEYKERLSVSKYDYELDKLITEDRWKIYKECGENDPYEFFPIKKFFKGDENTPHRAYYLDGCGGIAIIAHNNGIYHNFQILTLGEDDGNHFLNSADLYCRYFGNKASFISAISEALSLLNNNI